MWGRTMKVAMVSLTLIFLWGIAWAADSTTGATTAGTTTPADKATTDTGGEIDDAAMEAEFEEVYEELLKTDPEAAKLMKEEFDRADFDEIKPDWDPEKAEEEYQRVYKELVENGRIEEAEKMKEMHEKFQEWEKGGRVGPPPFEREGEHTWGEEAHEDMEHMTEQERSEYEKYMREHEGEYEHPEMEHERPEFEREFERPEHERENWQQDQRYDHQAPQ